MMMQLGLMMGAFRSIVAPVVMSSAQVWVGPSDTLSIDDTGTLKASDTALLWLFPEIDDIEPFTKEFGTLSLMAEVDELGDVERRFVEIVGTASSPDAMLFGKLVPAGMRSALAEPSTVIIDEVIAAGLGVEVGARVLINERPVRVIGALPGLRGAFTSTVITSQATARMVNGEGTPETSFMLLSLRDDLPPEAVDALLTSQMVPFGEGDMQLDPNLTEMGGPKLAFWTPEELIRSTMFSWAFTSFLGVIFMASVGIALVVTLLVVSQSLSGAVAASIREYAALRAYGLSFGRLQWLVMAQAGIVGIASLCVTGAVAGALIGYLGRLGVSLAMTPTLAISCAIALMAVVFLSNLMALRRLRKADPAALLR
ncbi:ABC transporter permease [Sulfitobacter sp. 1151]|uniref:ABC transporter permease n=2 Tax=Parasulfitobacter algicola TaxID=2614809 RepID=A0ABX2IR83_9RHOB|nr:ABC transporter permease [Sulfitobacter algicola]